jgi:ribulose 1,5-bisphosphate synthetase/thiazole synthase
MIVPAEFEERFMSTSLPDVAGSTELPSSADVVIVGGGVNGLSTAYQLARRGVTRVVVVE